MQIIVCCEIHISKWVVSICQKMLWKYNVGPIQLLPPCNSTQRGLPSCPEVVVFPSNLTFLVTCEAVLRLTGLDFLSVDQTCRERAMFPLPRGRTSYFLSDHVKCLKAWSNVNCRIPPHFWGWSCCKFVDGIKTMQDIWMIMSSFFIVKKKESF